MKIPQFLKINRNPEPARCCHQTKNRNPCNATPQAGKPYCFFHDPELAQERTAARRQGGITSIGKAAPVVPPNLPPVSLKTLDDVSQFFEQITNYVLQGQMDQRTAAILCSLANGKLRTLQAIERSQREAAKTTQAGKALRYSSKKKPSFVELTMVDAATGQERVVSTGDIDPKLKQWHYPDGHLKANSSSSIEHEHDEPGVPHSRESACGNNHDTLNSVSPTPKPNDISGELSADDRQNYDAQSDFALVKSFDEQRRQAPSAANDSPSAPPPAQPQVRDPDYEPACIPGLQNRHLNYLKYAGMPVPPSQRKRIRIDPEDVSSYSVRRVEFELNTARARRDGR